MKRTRRSKRLRAFTLIEASISIVLMGMLMLSVVSLYIFATRTVAATDGQMQACQDANKALTHIINETEIAGSVTLPGDPNWNTTQYPLSNYQTSGGTIDTAMLITNAGNGPTITFENSSGAMLNNPVPTFDTEYESATSTLIWRGDASMNPSPSAGQYLYETTNGVTTTIIKPTSHGGGLAPTAGALQFDWPTSTLNNEVEIKIVCSYYSPTTGSASNESTNGSAVTTLTGKCVMMRNAVTD